MRERVGGEQQLQPGSHSPARPHAPNRDRMLPGDDLDPNDPRVGTARRGLQRRRCRPREVRAVSISIACSGNQL